MDAKEIIISAMQIDRKAFESGEGTACDQFDILVQEIKILIPTSVPFQKCPKCDGQGCVSKPPFVPGDVHQWSSTSTNFPCDVCNGQKIMPMFLPNIEDGKGA